MQLYLSHEHNPYVNLAFEENLLHAGDEALYLWANEPCVVIGRNQNPFHEADLAFLKEHDIALARRLSGGGAVFHDLGNLNYSYISDGSDADLMANMALAVLERVSVRAQRTGRNDIAVGESKIGGLAEYHAESCLQHGTLMVDVNLDTMQRALRPSPLKLGKHGVDSVRSRVANLADIACDISIEKLIAAFEQIAGAPAEEAVMAPRVRERAEELASRNWLYGASPAFDVEMECLVDGDLYRIGLKVRAGAIEAATVSSDAYRPLDLDALARSIVGAEFDPDTADALIESRISRIV